MLAAWLVLSQTARADGAFADSLALLLPQTNPHRIIATEADRGLFVSDDDGETWSWVCEEAIGYSPGLYQLGPPPDETVYAIAQTGLVVSRDAGCSWQAIGGVLAGAGDVFPDPSADKHVFAVVQTGSQGETPTDEVIASFDGAISFGEPLFTTDWASITGIESAPSDPATLYLAMFSLSEQQPYLARSSDSGVNWTTLNLTAQLDRQTIAVRILAIDPNDPRTLYLRTSNGLADTLAISHDAGEHVQTALHLAARMSAFLLRNDGAIIVAAEDGTSFSAASAQDPFTPWSSAFHIRALAERAAVIYAVADFLQDGIAIAATSDGASWRTLLTIDRLQGVRACGALASQCAAAWTQWQSSPARPAAEPDTAVSPAPSSHSDSGCSALPPRRSASATAWISVLCVLRRRRARRPRVAPR